MKKSSLIFKTFTLSVLLSVMVNSLISQDKYPAPTKKVNCLAIDNFVAQAFELHYKISTITISIEDIVKQTTTSGPNLQLLQQLNENYSTLQGLGSTVQALISASASVPDNLKKVSILKVLVATKNIKAALEVLAFSGKQITNLVGTIIPDAKKKLEVPDNIAKTDAPAKS